MYAQDNSHFPFGTDSTHLTVWNGEQYTSLFIKGINLGIAKPGTFPGELKASENDYLRWFGQIHEAGFNAIRIYTLHFPAFYKALHQYNTAHPQYPLLLIQGIWLEEEIENYTEDLYELNAIFREEIQHNIRAVHGDVEISSRAGKAFGAYEYDCSPWLLAYIIGREIHPPEVTHTNELRPDLTAYTGTYLSISDVHATEVWLTEILDFLLDYEMEHYQTQRPVSVSSWPTLDPLSHPFEPNQYEDQAYLDFAKMDFSKAEAGFFVSYHAYPYYPDFISNDPNYIVFNDYIGQNSYLGYLTYLKNYYGKIPLLIAEFGTPTSWGNAHFAQNGIHHGGLDEVQQGNAIIRMLKNNEQAHTAGGIVFSWMDEWFKRTWLTDDFDFNADRRILWHNIASSEQNFGLMEFKKDDESIVEENINSISWLKSIRISVDYSFFNITLKTENHLGSLDTLWISFDTYKANLGESILPNGAQLNNRAEFLLKVMNSQAELFVTEAYDSFGLWDNSAPASQYFQSTATDGNNWNLLRWRNNVEDKETQYVGRLKVNRLDTPPSSLDAVRLTDSTISIRLPWNFIHFTDPSRMEVLHDDRAIAGTQTQTSDGVQIGIRYKQEAFDLSNRVSWATWNQVTDVHEELKTSYAIVKEEMGEISGNPVAFPDTVLVSANGESQPFSVLSNDKSYDSKPMQAILADPAKQGLITLNPDGTFRYQPVYGFNGNDSFKYRARSGTHISEPVSVFLNVNENWQGTGFIELFPNPVSDLVRVRSQSVIDSVRMYSALGQLVLKKAVNSSAFELSVQSLSKGVYFMEIISKSDRIVKKFVVI
ncbi:T9SS type A sorting domain-containing protein [bacterium]|nr:MAG: T9SS type A sorting domain-containing protein [bacterium]